MTSSPQPVPPAPALAAADRRLLDECFTGRPGAWDEFVSRFAGLFSFIAAKVARQRGRPLAAADRDDLVAEILLECLRNDAAALRSFAGRSSLSTYLAVIARRVAVRGLLRSEPAARPATRVVLSGGRDHAAQAADREHVEQLMGRLDPAEAQLVRLHHLEARSYGEISRITGLPLGSIGPALSKAREKMKAMESD